MAEPSLTVELLVNVKELLVTQPVSLLAVNPATGIAYTLKGIVNVESVQPKSFTCAQ